MINRRAFSGPRHRGAILDGHRSDRASSTSARSIYCLDAKTWVVEKRFNTPGNRPHGLAWEGRYLWHGDSNDAAFFKFDVETGGIVEKIQLTDADPIAHGLTIWNGTLWYCDDVGVVCTMKI
jgi:hypothetical protein